MITIDIVKTGWGGGDNMHRNALAKKDETSGQMFICSFSIALQP